MRIEVLALGALITLLIPATSHVVSAQSPCPPTQVTMPLDVIAMIGGDYSDFGFSQEPTTSNISIGQFANAHSMTEDFVLGNTSGAAQIVATGSWLAPISQNGSIVETITYLADGSSCVLAGIGDGAEIGTAISQMGSGDILFNEWPQSAWFKLNGTTVTGLNTAALALHPDPLSLADYQTAVVDRYEDSDFDPDLSGSQTASEDMRQAERPETSRPLVLATLMSALGVLAVWAVRRFR